jgi:hypothetical protein
MGWKEIKKNLFRDKKNLFSSFQNPENRHVRNVLASASLLQLL